MEKGCKQIEKMLKKVEKTNQKVEKKRKEKRCKKKLKQSWKTNETKKRKCKHVQQKGLKGLKNTGKTLGKMFKRLEKVE